MSIGSDVEGVVSASAEIPRWVAVSARAVIRRTVGLVRCLEERGPPEPRHFLEAEPNNAAADGGGLGGNELIELVVLDSIWRNFASIIAILLSVLIQR